MSHLVITLIAATVVILVAFALVAIGYLITGKWRVQFGACGRAPKRDEQCGGEKTCSLCSPEKKDEDVREGKS